MSDVEFLPRWYVRKRRARARMIRVAAAIAVAVLLSIVFWAAIHRA